MTEASNSQLRIHYHVEGRGPNVLLLHGWSSSRRMWQHLTPALARTHRCWSLDLPGFGDSDKPADGWYSIPRFTASVRAFMDSMGLDQASVVGHSMGGMIALDLAALCPERVARLVVINPVVTGRAYLRAFATLRPQPSLWQQTHAWSRRLIHPVVRHPLSTTLHRGVRYMGRRAEDFTRATPESLLGSGRAIATFDTRPGLARITAPTLVILGKLDAQVPNSEGHIVAAHVPNARLRVYTAGHAITDDYPGEMVRGIRDFIG